MDKDKETFETWNNIAPIYQDKFIKMALSAIFLVLLSCNAPHKGSLPETEKNVVNIEKNEDYEDDDFDEEYEILENSNNNENSEPGETRLRFKHFTLVIHNFKSYETDGDFNERTYSGQFGGGSDWNEAILNDNEIENEDYKETLISLKDTLHLMNLW